MGVERSVTDELTRLGGVSTRAQLVTATSRAEVDAAVAGGEVVVLARGRCALVGVGAAEAAAHRVTGTLCLESAAVFQGWGVKAVPERPQVALAKGRKLTTSSRMASRSTGSPWRRTTSTGPRRARTARWWTA